MRVLITVLLCLVLVGVAYTQWPGSTDHLDYYPAILEHHEGAHLHEIPD